MAPKNKNKKQTALQLYQGIPGIFIDADLQPAASPTADVPDLQPAASSSADVPDLQPAASSSAIEEFKEDDAPAGFEEEVDAHRRGSSNDVAEEEETESAPAASDELNDDEVREMNWLNEDKELFFTKTRMEDISAHRAEPAPAQSPKAKAKAKAKAKVVLGGTAKNLDRLNGKTLTLILERLMPETEHPSSKPQLVAMLARLLDDDSDDSEAGGEDDPDSGTDVEEDA